MADDVPSTDSSLDATPAPATPPLPGLEHAVQAAEAAPGSSVDPLVIESLLMATDRPLTATRLAELLDIITVGPIRRAIEKLNSVYAQSGRSFRIEQIAGGYQILSLPEYAPMVERLRHREGDARLSRSVLETLAIIAYKQPVLRADVEAIRGVACGEAIRNLMEKRLVRIVGRAEEPGRPMLYGTTQRFLEVFGLNNLKELPQAESLPKPLDIKPAAPTASAPDTVRE